MRFQKLLSLLLLLGIIGVIFGVQFGNVLFSPNQWLLNSEGDATKNYYTPWYHVLHDSTAHWFEGMNYPHGDHVVFADAQPALTNTLRVIHHHIAPIGHFTPGIMNLVMLLSVFWAGWLLFLILRRWGLPLLYSAVWAGLLAALSPQIFRLNGHFALAYACVVPLIWYCLIRYRERRSWRWTAVLAAIGIVLSGLHPYYLMVHGLLVGAITLFDWVVPGEKPNWKVLLPHFLAQVVVPLAFFKVYLALTDPITDRPETPYGFFAYTSSWKSVFFEYLFPWVQDARKALHLKPVHPEGYAYVGFPGLVLLLAGLFWLIKNFFRRKWRALKTPFADRERNIVLFASLLIFLFASGYLFPGKVGEWVSSVPLLAQFRSTGRFAWIFFYLWGGLTAWALWDWWQRQRTQGRTWLAHGIMGFLLVILAAEGGYYNYLVRRDHAKAQPLSAILHRAEPLQKAITPFLPQTNAFLFIPYYHIGSENFSPLRRSSFADEMMVSLQTGVPMVNASLSRTSFGQAWKHVQFPLWQLEVPDLIADLPMGFRLLAIENEEARRKNLRIPWLRDEEAVYADSSFRVWRITRDVVENSPAMLREAMQDCLTDSVAAHAIIAGDRSVQGDPDATWGPFDVKAKRIPLLKLDLPAGDSVHYFLSFWVKMRRDQVPVSRLWLAQQPGDGRADYKQEIFVQSWLKAMVGEWAMVEVEVVPPYGDVPLVVEWQPYGDRNYAQIRSWLLRRSDRSVCWRDSVSGGIFWNNMRERVEW